MNFLFLETLFGIKQNLQFVLDTANSTCNADLIKSINFAISIVNSFVVSSNKTQFGLSLYLNQSKILFPFNNETTAETMRSSINSVIKKQGLWSISSKC